MAFNISAATEGTYTWPVPVYMPIDGGRHKKDTFTGTFSRAFTLDEITEGVEDLPKILVGWSDIIDSAGAQVAFTPAALAEYAKIPIFVSAVFEAWRNSFSQAKTKN